MTRSCRFLLVAVVLSVLTNPGGGKRLCFQFIGTSHGEGLVVRQDRCIPPPSVEYCHRCSGEQCPQRRKSRPPPRCCRYRRAPELAQMGRRRLAAPPIQNFRSQCPRAPCSGSVLSIFAVVFHGVREQGISRSHPLRHCHMHRKTTLLLIRYSCASSLQVIHSYAWLFKCRVHCRVSCLAPTAGIDDSSVTDPDVPYAEGSIRRELLLMSNQAVLGVACVSVAGAHRAPAP